MIKSKRGDSNILIILVTMMVVALMIVMGIVFAFVYYVGGHDFAVLPLYTAAVGFNASPEIQAGFENTVESYEAIDVSGVADNIFFFAWFFASAIGYGVAYRSRGTGNFSFLSMLTFGLMFILYIFSFFLVIMQWLYFDILLNLFINLIPNLPKLEWFLTFGGIVFLLQASTMLLLKVVDLDFRSFFGRRKAEENYDNDDLTT